MEKKYECINKEHRTVEMNILLIKQNGHDTTYEIPEFIDSMVLFDTLNDIEMYSIVRSVFMSSHYKLHTIHILMLLIQIQ